MDVQLHRKQRLRELMNHHCGGVIAVLAEKISRNESYVSRMFYPPDKAGAKPIADKMMLVIESAFGLERAWLDMPLGYGLPQEPGAAVDTTPHIADGPPSRRGGQIDWPFKIVSYRRLMDLKQALGAKLGHEAIRDIDKHLEIVTLKWEKEAQSVKSRNAA